MAKATAEPLTEAAEVPKDVRELREKVLAGEAMQHTYASLVGLRE
jgi:hypothetical protein